MAGLIHGDEIWFLTGPGSLPEPTEIQRIYISSAFAATGFLTFICGIFYLHRCEHIEHDLTSQRAETSITFPYGKVATFDTVLPSDIFQ
jgi:hypothetical protein